MADYPATSYAIDSWKLYPERFWHGDIYQYTTKGYNRYGEYTNTQTKWLSLSENLIVYLDSNQYTFSDQKAIEVYAYTGSFAIEDGSLRGGTVNQLLHINSGSTNPQREAPRFTTYNYKRAISIERGLPNSNELEWLIESSSWTSQSTSGKWSTVTGSGTKDSTGQWSRTSYQSHPTWEDAKQALIEKGFPLQMLLEYFPFTTKPNGLFNYEQDGDFYNSLGFDSTRKYNTAPTGLHASASGFLENIPAGSSVGNIVMFDPDPGDTLTLSLASGEGDDDNRYFSVTDNELIINHSPDAESKGEYKVRLRASDERGLYIEQAIRLQNYNVQESTDYLTGIRQTEKHISSVQAPSRFGKPALSNTIQHQAGTPITIDAESFKTTVIRKVVVTTKKAKSTKLARKNIGFVFDNAKSILYFNENGRAPGWGMGGIIATIDTSVILTASDFSFL